MKVHEFFSPHFTMEELTRSRRFPFVANIPTEEVVGNLQALCDNVLEPLRRVWKAPIYVNSAYRCRRLNKLVGGVRSSQHCLGQAADITTGDCYYNTRLGNLIRGLDLPFDQLIFENWDPELKVCDWIHVSYGPRHRHQVIHKKKGKN